MMGHMLDLTDDTTRAIHNGYTALRLILIIEENPDSNTEVIKLCSASRRQLEKAADELGSALIRRSTDGCS